MGLYVPLLEFTPDKLRSYGVAHRELVPDSIHDTFQYANNRAELSHQPTRVRERGMRRFKSMEHKLNDSRMCMLPCIIYLILAVIWYLPVIIGI